MRYDTEKTCKLYIVHVPFAIPQTRTLCSSLYDTVIQTCTLYNLHCTFSFLKPWTMYVHVYFVVPFNTLYNVHVSFVYNHAHVCNFSSLDTVCAIYMYPLQFPIRHCTNMYNVHVQYLYGDYKAINKGQCISLILCSSLYDTVQLCTMYVYPFQFPKHKPCTMCVFCLCVFLALYLHISFVVPLMHTVQPIKI